MKNKPYFPMFIDLSDKNIVVAGGGNIATRRIKTLLKFYKKVHGSGYKSDPGAYGSRESRNRDSVYPSRETF